MILFFLSSYLKTCGQNCSLQTKIFTKRQQTVKCSEQKENKASKFQKFGWGKFASDKNGVWLIIRCMWMAKLK